eukprot:TRINITY_DN5633_c0_g1_i4.p1 TRINITY_DN5633_c0_g1~~TRINITY_DN5633_c0_g1_i4.p1  ORF type:complete len:399 (+),score=25.41 TRINITY_DN5633_c0_g1_i4:183-1379(+)
MSNHKSLSCKLQSRPCSRFFSGFDWCFLRSMYKISSPAIVIALVNAVNAGIPVSVVYHKMDISNKLIAKNVEAHRALKFFNESEQKSNQPFLRVTQIKWGDKSSEQMHAKYLVVENMPCPPESELNQEAKEENPTVYSWLYVSSSNIDAPAKEKAWQQSGVLISSLTSPDSLFSRFAQYRQVLENFPSDQRAFQTYMYQHSASMMYTDEHIQAYFYPVAPDLVWHNAEGHSLNPLAWLCSIIQQHTGEMMSGQCEVSFGMNMAFYRGDAFGSYFSSLLSSIHDQVFCPPLESPLKIFSVIMEDDPNDQLFPMFSAKYTPVHTHSKNYILRVHHRTPDSLAKEDLFFTLLGSSNCKQNEYVDKANVQLLFKERGRGPINDAFLTIHNLAIAAAPASASL